LFPVLPLQDIGCGSVTYITRKGGQPLFATGVAKLLGISDKESEKFLSIGKSSRKELSSFEKAIHESDAVWCTDWDNPNIGSTQIEETMMSSFNSSLELRNPTQFYDNPLKKYPRVSKNLSEKGCSRK
jgi:hypothetical protein